MRDGRRFKKIFEQADMDEDEDDIAEYERIVMSVSRTFLRDRERMK